MFRNCCCIILLVSFILTACYKERLLTGTDARIGTSSDSLYFDTLFTQALSTTQSFRIFNQNNQKIKLSSIRLAGGSASVFRININGEAGPVANDIEIAANDSIHIFVNTQVPDGNSAYPFIVEDSVIVEWNNNVKAVKLSAWGQKAKFIKNGTVEGNTEWNNDLPIVILGELRISENAKLHITKGTRIHCHADAPIIVDGTLQVSGDTAYKDRVIFSGDRLDEPYRSFPASWPGIYFTNSSQDNQLDYAIIKNAYQGIIATGLPAPNHTKLLLQQCIIDNIWDAGFLAVNTSAELFNCLISNCGQNVQLLNGGNYHFTHCTISSYSTLYSTHKEPVVLISDAVMLNNELHTAPLEASFINTICWGNSGAVENEVICSRQGQLPFSVLFTDGLWQMKEIPALITSNNMINGVDPGFENVSGLPENFNFRLNASSPALDKGQVTILTVDLDGKPRNYGIPDLGAYEKQ